jgi:TPR repeat protein
VIVEGRTKKEKEKKKKKSYANTRKRTRKLKKRENISMGGAASKTTEEHGGTVESILGSAQLSGESDFPHSSRDAVAFFELAADLDDPAGMCNLADCLMNGWGVGRDPWKAYDLYRRAAEAPHFWRPAMHCVALCHRHGEGLDDDLDDALNGREK